MKFCCATLFLLMGAISAWGEAVRPNVHVINDETQVRELRRALNHAAKGPRVGPVLANPVTVYYVWYGDWNGNNGITLLESLARNLGGSPYYNINTTYTDDQGNAVKNRLLFGGSAVDGYSLGKTLNDEQIWQAVSGAIAAGKFPADPDGVYFLLTSADVQATSGFCTSYCGWHSQRRFNGTPIQYAFVGDSGRCPEACSAQPDVSPNGNPGVDAMASVLVHELNALVSNPGSNDGHSECAWEFGSTFLSANGAKANVTLGGRDYLLEQNWVNVPGGGCASGYVVPEVTGVSPSEVSPGSRVPVTLSGSSFTDRASIVISGEGFTVSDVVVESPERIHATLTVAPEAETGSRQLQVAVGAGVSAPVRLAVGVGPASIFNISPNKGPRGSLVAVTLTGANFATGAALAVSGDGVKVSNVKAVSTSKITADLTIDPGASTGARSLSLTSNGSKAVFTVAEAAATLSSISPATGIAGSTTKVTIGGTNFVPGASVVVSGAGVTVSGVTVVSATQITANLVIAAGAVTGVRYVTVTSGTASTAPVAFTIAAPMTLTAVSPASATAGSTVKVILSGSNFATGVGVALSGSGVTVSGVTAINPNQISATLVIDKAAAPGGRSMTVMNGSVSTAPVTFSVTPANALSNLSPSNAGAGDTVRVTITGTQFTAGATIAVTGGDVTVNSVIVVSASQITANFVIDPLAPPGPRTVTFTSGTLTSGPSIFTINSAPMTVVGDSPSATLAGNTVPVILTGTHFTNGSTVAITGTGITVSAVAVVSPTRITAQFAIDKSAVTGPRTVTVSNGTTTTVSGVTFTVNPTPAAPVVTQLSVSSGAACDVVNIVVTGSNFSSSSALNVSGAGITIIKPHVVSTTQITATFSIAATAAAGARAVTVRNATGSSTALTFTVSSTAPPPPSPPPTVPPPGPGTTPSVSSVSPASGVLGSALTMTVIGSGFSASTVIVVADHDIPVLHTKYVSPTQMSVVLGLSGSVGTHSLQVSTKGGATSAASAPVSFFITAPPAPTITSATPPSAGLGKTVSVMVRGANFTPDLSVSMSGSGVTIGNFTSASSTLVTLTITVASNASLGPRTVAIKTAGGTSNPVTFTVVAK